MGSYRVGIDIGGTFTDLTALETESGELTNVKVPSTPSRPGLAAVGALKRLLKTVKGEQITLICHATTIASNVLRGQAGLDLPSTALITTKGFRDVLEIRRQRRHELYNLFVRKPPALVPRRRRYELDERISATGEELRPVDASDVQRLAQKLKGDGARSVAIVLLNSHMNPDHENLVAGMLRTLCPETFLSASNEFAREHREYERTSTTVVNASLMPMVASYLDELVEGIKSLRVEAPLCIMKSSGGVASKEAVSRAPATMIESGPAAGAIAAGFYAEALGVEQAMSFDMGGTTAKAAIVKAGFPEITHEYEVGGEVHVGRVVKGSGYPVRFPFVDLAECSAGGGTVAWVDEGGSLRVGPGSAGAEPGPACYGKGGIEPTVTDAHVVLGRLNPACLLGGTMKIFSKLSLDAIKSRICDTVGLSPAEASSGITTLANLFMAKILRVVSTERGLDPRDFTLIAFGGAGPLHACPLAEEIGVRRVIIPPSPGMFSAYGLLAADFKQGFVHAIMKEAEELDSSDVEAVFTELEEKGRKLLREEKMPPEKILIVRQLDMRYRGQGYELTVPTSAPFSKERLADAVDSFHMKHQAIYGYANLEQNTELVNARLFAVGTVAKPRLTKKPLLSQKAEEAVVSRREAFFEDVNGFASCKVYLREKLSPRNVIPGPAIVEQYDSTTVVYPSWSCKVDEFGDLVMEQGG